MTTLSGEDFDSKSLFLVGLGNYGNKTLFKYMRHNVGSDTISYLNSQLKLKTHKYKSMSISQYLNAYLIVVDGNMNSSAQNFYAQCKSYKPKISQLVVIYDDVELSYGKMVFQKGGSAKGHNGVRSYISYLNNDSFWRIRIGVSKEQPLDRYVLSKHSSDQWGQILKIQQELLSCLNEFIMNVNNHQDQYKKIISI